MKKIIIAILIYVISNSADAQSFAAYEKITDTDFKDFVSLFEKRNLPISTDDLLENSPWLLQRSQNAKIAEIEKGLLDKFLLIPGKGKFIFRINDIVSEDGKMIEDFGKLYPLYRLPTNGDYVILVIAQISRDSPEFNKVFAYSFNLEANPIYSIINLFYGSGPFIYGEITQEFNTITKYAFGDNNGVKTAVPNSGKFKGIVEEEMYELTSNGKRTLIEQNNVPAIIEYDFEENRYKVKEYL